MDIDLRSCMASISIVNVYICEYILPKIHYSHFLAVIYKVPKAVKEN